VNWDGFQREVLAELGLSVYVLAGAPAAVDAPAADKHPPSPLLLALLRAANAGPKHADAVALCRDFLAAYPKPSAKTRREFWPQLRRLRAAAS